MAEYKKEEEGPKETDEEILEEVREYVKQCIDDEDVEREKMKDDLRFCTLDQWPSDIRNDREGDVENGPRPCLTIDKINQYIVQVVNDMRQGKPGINVRPQDDNADVETAKILKGIIRNIEDQSSADIAYAVAGENAAKIGLGYVRVVAEYVDDESDDQELRIKPIPNTFTVYLGRHIMPDGSDAERGFIMEAVSVEKFKEEYPNAKCTANDFDGVEKDQLAYWRTDDTVTVIEEYCLYKENRQLHHLADGTTISSEDYDAWPAEAGAKPTIRKSRTTTKKKLKWRKCTAVEVLDSRDLPGQYIPIAEVVGRESWVDGKRIVWGLVRPAKDSLRMYNYWASSITEKLGLATKTPFIGAKGQFEGLEDQWRKANRINKPYLEYNPIDVNGNAIPAPVRQGPSPMEAAYFHFMEVIEHDVQTSLGMFKAAVGETESQQSGRAILALQKESDTGTYHFGANLGVTIRHIGRICLDLIPHIYDTKRIVRIIGEDGEVRSVQLDPEQEGSMKEVQDTPNSAIRQIYNPTIGKYDISITPGISYTTKRMEDQATFVEMAKGAADPGSAAVLRYLVMKNSDSPGAAEAANLLKSMLPPQAAMALQSKDPIPPKVMAQMQQMQQQMTQMKEEGAKLQQENMQLKSGAQVSAMKIRAEAMADAEKLRMEKIQMMAEQAQDREKAAADLRLEQLKSAGNLELERTRAANDLKIAEERMHAEIRLAREKADAEIKLAREKAEADLAIKRDIARKEPQPTASA